MPSWGGQGQASRWQNLCIIWTKTVATQEGQNGEVINELAEKKE